MASSEYNVESIVILILAEQGALPTAQHYDGTEIAPTVERLAVKCAPKTPFFSARAMFLPPVLWQAVVTIEYHMPISTAIATYDAAVAAIDAAMTGTPPVGATAEAETAFPQGMGIDITDGGDKQPIGNDIRSISRTYRAFWAEA